MNLWARARVFLADEAGQDLVEYGILATLIAIAAVAAVQTFGSTLNAFFANIVDQVKSA